MKKRQGLLPLLFLLWRTQMAALTHCLPCTQAETAASLIISAVMLASYIFVKKRQNLLPLLYLHMGAQMAALTDCLPFSHAGMAVCLII